MDVDPINENLLPFDEAVSLIKRKGRTRRIAIHVGGWARYTIQNPVKLAEGYENGTNGVGACVRVTLRQALKYLDDCYPAHWQPKLSLRVGLSKRCMFIGSSPR